MQIANNLISCHWQLCGAIYPSICLNIKRIPWFEIFPKMALNNVSLSNQIPAGTEALIYIPILLVWCIKIPFKTEELVRESLGLFKGQATLKIIIRVMPKQGQWHLPGDSRPQLGTGDLHALHEDMEWDGSVFLPLCRETISPRRSASMHYWNNVTQVFSVPPRERKSWFYSKTVQFADPGRSQPWTVGLSFTETRG